MLHSGGIMLPGSNELLEENSASIPLRPTQVKFVFLGLEAPGGCCGETVYKDRSSTK